MARGDLRVSGERLRTERLHRLLTAEEASAAIGITRGALSRAEAGGPVRIDTVRAIAEFYGVPGKELVILGEAVA